MHDVNYKLSYKHLPVPDSGYLMLHVYTGKLSLKEKHPEQLGGQTQLIRPPTLYIRPDIEGILFATL